MVASAVLFRGLYRRSDRDKKLKNMKTKKFKTNIMCGSCIAKVTSVLNETFGENNWEVDINDPKKILTVSADLVDENKMKKSLERVGYRAEVLV